MLDAGETWIAGPMLDIIKRLWVGKPSTPLQQRARLDIPEDRVEDIFAVGDIHGRLDLLLAAEQRIVQRMAGKRTPALVVFLGDFIDRGPESKGVVDHLMRKMPPPLYRICICGNHDDAFVNFLAADKFDTAWLEFGGVATLLSYGIDATYLLKLDPTGEELKKAAKLSVPAAHVDFIEKLPVAARIGRYLFVHAGILPGHPLSEQSDIDLMWIREPFLSRGPGLDLTVVHGHTPSAAFQYGPNRIGIDTGAYATGKLGVLHIGPHGVAEI